MDDETTSKHVFLKCLPCLDEWMSVSLEYTFTKLYNCSPCDSVRIVSLEINKACFRDRVIYLDNKALDVAGSSPASLKLIIGILFYF